MKTLNTLLRDITRAKGAYAFHLLETMWFNPPLVIFMETLNTLLRDITKARGA